MSDVRYMISDAAKLVDVEAHVLRYWEEELDLPTDAMRWDTVIIQKKISGYSGRSKN